jgi:hypothetical protein
VAKHSRGTVVGRLLDALDKQIFDLFSAPGPSPGSVQNEIEIRIGADISASGVVHGVPILARGDAVSFRDRRDRHYSV